MRKNARSSHAPRPIARKELLKDAICAALNRFHPSAMKETGIRRPNSRQGGATTRSMHGRPVVLGVPNRLAPQLKLVELFRRAIGISQGSVIVPQSNQFFAVQLMSSADRREKRHRAIFGAAHRHPPARTMTVADENYAPSVSTEPWSSPLPPSSPAPVAAALSAGWLV